MIFKRFLVFLKRFLKYFKISLNLSKFLLTLRVLKQVKFKAKNE